jgi:hypothetical protein
MKVFYLFGSKGTQRRPACVASAWRHIAHFLLDFLCKQSVSGGQRSPPAEGFQGLQFLSPASASCLRGVAVVAAR